MATALAAAGFTRVWCTPHRISGLYEAAPDSIRSRVAELQEHLTRAGIHLTVLPGSEYCLDEFLLAKLVDPLPLDDSRVLVELPPSARSSVVSDIFFRMIQKGQPPLIAHPERSPVLAFSGEREDEGGFSPLAAIKALLSGRRLRKEPREVEELPPLVAFLKEMGCRFQGNIGSFAGLYGDTVRETACRYLRAGLYDRLGSDAHFAEGMSDWLPDGLAEISKLIGPVRMKRKLRGPVP